MKWGVRRYRNEDGSLTRAGKRKYLNDMYKDMLSKYTSQISKEAGKVSTIGRNGYLIRGMAWTDAWRKGKVSFKDADNVRSASRKTRDYALQKYGKSARDALAKSDFFTMRVSDFIIKEPPKF